MSTPGPDRIARLMLLGHREGGFVQLDEAARVLGVPEADVPRTLGALARGELGVPPFFGEDVASIVVEGELIRVSVPDELGLGWPLHATDAACLTASLRAVRGGLPRAHRVRCDALLTRLRAAVDPEVHDELDARARALAWAVSEAVDPEVVSAAARAADGREVVSLRVYNASRDAVQTREVWALSLVQHGPFWYLCARDPGDRRLRWWRLDRVLAVSATGRTHRAARPTSAEVRRPVLFDPPEQPLTVTVRVDDALLARARSVLTVVSARPTLDGGALLRVHTPRVPMLLRQLFGLGPGWEVVEPADARAEVRAWVARMGG